MLFQKKKKKKINKEHGVYAGCIMRCMTISNICTLHTLYTELSAIFAFSSQLATHSTHSFISKSNTVAMCVIENACLFWICSHPIMYCFILNQNYFQSELLFQKNQHFFPSSLAYLDKTIFAKFIQMMPFTDCETTALIVKFQWKKQP